MQQVHHVSSGGLSAGKLRERLQNTAAQRLGDMKDLQKSLLVAVVVHESPPATGGTHFKEVVSASSRLQRFELRVDLNSVTSAVEHSSGGAHSHQPFVEEESRDA